MSRKMLIDGEVDGTAQEKIKSELDLFVIGAGSSGVRAARFSAQYGAKGRNCDMGEKKTGDRVIRINSETSAREFLKKHSMFVVGLFDKFEGPDYEEFKKITTSDSEIQFIETSRFEVVSVLFPDIKTNSRFLGIVKSDPERYTAFEGTFETEKMSEFVDINKFPLVTTVT